jgi:hypothetical protein
MRAFLREAGYAFFDQTLSHSALRLFAKGLRPTAKASAQAQHPAPVLRPGKLSLSQGKGVHFCLMINLLEKK